MYILMIYNVDAQKRMQSSDFLFHSNRNLNVPKIVMALSDILFSEKHFRGSQVAPCEKMYLQSDGEN
jgi:hypothetical protein